MKNKCPGRLAPRDLDSVLLPCPGCGKMLELFTDEPSRRCKCGRLVLREAAPKCAEWCAAAAECFGEVIDVRKLKKRLDEVRNDPKAKECFDRIRRRLEQKGKDDAKA